MLDNASDIPQGFLGQTTVEIASKDVTALGSNGLVAVHARAIITGHRLWHKGSGLTKLLGDVLYHILVEQHFVSFFGQGVKAGSDLVLTGGCHFVVVSLNY